jgi:hypothetical protein
MRTDAELDEFAKVAHEFYHVGRITIRSDTPLLYPEAGFFPLVWKKDDGMLGTAVALPASGRHVFVAVPRSMDWTSATELWAQNGAAFIANMSVGASSRVVIPPFALGNLQTAGVMIRRLREDTRELIALGQEHNAALARLNAAVEGLSGAA